MRRIIFFCMIYTAIAAALPPAVVATEPADTPGNTAIPAQPSPLLIAIPEDFPPGAFLNSVGEPAGIMVDIWRLWSRKTGIPIEFRATTWKESIVGLIQGEADIHSGLFFSDERSEWLEFSHPIYSLQTGIYYPKKLGPFRHIDNMANRRLGVVSGSLAETYVADAFPEVHLISYSTIEEMVLAAKNYWIQGFAGSILSSDVVLARLGLSGEFRRIEENLFRREVRAGVRKGATDLLRRIEEGFHRITTQELADIESHWIPDPGKRYYGSAPFEVPLTKKEEIWLGRHRQIRIGLPAKLPPLTFLEEGVFKGIYPDYLDLITRYTGIRFTLVHTPPAEDYLALKQRDTDMIIASFDATESARSNASRPIMRLQLVIVMRKDAPVISGLGALQGKKLAVIRGIQLHNRIIEAYTGITPYPTGSLKGAMEAVASGEADALVVEMVMIGYLMQQYPDLKIAGTTGFPAERIMFAVRDDYPELLSILNKTIEAISPSERDLLIQKWFTVKLESPINWTPILLWSGGISAVFAFFAVFFLFWNRRMAAEILERKRVEHSLKESERRLKEAESMARLGHWEMDVASGRCIWSDEFFRICGFEPGELVPSSEKGLQIIHPDDRERARQTLQKAIEAGGDYRIEKRIVQPGGAVRTVTARGEIRLDPKGRPTKLIGTFQDITDIRKTEEKLLKTNLILNKVGKIAKIGGWELDMETRRLFWTDEMYHLRKVDGDFTPDLAKALSFYPPASRPTIEHAIERAMAEGISYDLELESLSAEGDRIWIHTICTPVKENGRVSKLIGTVQDITDRKEIEQALQESENKYRTLFHALPLGITLSDPDGNVREANEFAESILGVPELVHRNRRIDGSDWQIIRADGTPLPAEEYPSVRSLKENRTFVNAEMGIVKPDGALKWIHVTATPIPLESYGVLVAFSDITAHKKAQEALAESEVRFRALYRTMNEGLCIHELVQDTSGSPTDYRILEVNPTYERLMNIPQEKAIGSMASELYGSGEAPFLDIYAEVVETGRPTTFDASFDFLDKHFNVSAFSPGKGKFAAVFTDVTELVNARKSAEAASLAKSQFIANMNHEFRTPLNAILGFTQMLKRDDRLAEHQREKIATIHKSGEHLLSLINDVLDIAKIESGKLTLEEKPLELKTLLRNMVDIFRVKAYQKHIELIQEIDPNLPNRVLCDEKRLRQVLLNLLSNAVKFTREGSVRFRVRPSGHRISFSVADSGPGIPEENLEEIFEAFKQVNPNGNNIEGAGLGLAISRDLVRLMGGEIAVQSEWNRGSTFTFEIPLPVLSEAPSEPERAEERNIIGYEGPRKKALIVDDERMDRYMIRATLEPLGFLIEEAAGGREALERFQTFKPDIAFVDLSLSDIDPLRLIEGFDGGGLSMRPIICVVSGESRPEVKERFMRSGADEFIVKPIVLDDLLSKVRHHLGLTWRYSDTRNVSPPPRNIDHGSLSPPPLRDMEILRSMAGVGDIIGIREYAAELREEKRETRQFCDALIEWSRDFNFPGIEKLLHTHMGERNE